MKIVNKIKILVVILFVLLAQEKVLGQEKLYILFNEENGDTVINDKNILRFYLKPTIDASSFTHSEKNEKKEIGFKQVKNKLHTKWEANEKFKKKLDAQAQKFKDSTNLKSSLYKQPPFNFNARFEKIYIYKAKNRETGCLYEVSWDYAIE